MKRIYKNNVICYICEACNFAYKDKKIAKKCEDYCKKHKSCSLEITKKSIKI